MPVRQNRQKGIAMVNPNRITHDEPELKDVPPGFPASTFGKHVSLCDMCDMMKATA